MTSGSGFFDAIMNFGSDKPEEPKAEPLQVPKAQVPTDTAPSKTKPAAPAFVAPAMKQDRPLIDLPILSPDEATRLFRASCEVSRRAHTSTPQRVPDSEFFARQGFTFSIDDQSTHQRLKRGERHERPTVAAPEVDVAASQKMRRQIQEAARVKAAAPVAPSAAAPAPVSASEESMAASQRMRRKIEEFERAKTAAPAPTEDISPALEAPTDTRPATDLPARAELVSITEPVEAEAASPEPVAEPMPQVIEPLAEHAPESASEVVAEEAVVSQDQLAAEHDYNEAEDSILLFETFDEPQGETFGEDLDTEDADAIQPTATTTAFAETENSPAPTPRAIAMPEPAPLEWVPSIEVVEDEATSAAQTHVEPFASINEPTARDASEDEDEDEATEAMEEVVATADPAPTNVVSTPLSEALAPPLPGKSTVSEAVAEDEPQPGAWDLYEQKLRRL